MNAWLIFPVSCLAACLLSLSFLYLPGCSNSGTSITNPPAQPTTGELDQLLPAPAQLKRPQAYDNAVYRRGNDFYGGWLNQNVLKTVTNTGVYSPFYGPGSPPSSLAVAIYGFDVTGYDHDTILKTNWLSAHDYADCWIGMADFASNTWRLYNLDASNQMVFPADCVGTSSEVYAAVILMGTDVWELGAIYLGLDPAPDIIGIDPAWGYTGAVKVFEGVCDLAPGDDTTWSWDFGAGATPNTSTEAQPSVTLGPAGVYPGLVTATNAGSTSEFRFYLNVVPDEWPWEIEVAHSFDQLGELNSDTSLALDPATGDPYILYADNSWHDVFMLNNDGHGWQRQMVGNGSAFTAISTASLAFDSNDTIHAVYFNSPLLVSATKPASIWLYETIYDADPDGLLVGDCTSPALALAADDSQHVSFFYDGTEGAEAATWIEYIYHNDATTETTTIDSAADSYEPYAPVCVDSNGSPVIAYLTHAPNYELRFAKWNTTWENWDDSLVSDEYDIVAIDMVITPSDSPYICYVVEDTGDGTLYYAFFDGSEWISLEVLGAGNASNHLAMAVSESGRPFIAYFEKDGANLCCAERDGLVWDIYTIDAEGTVGMYCDIAISASDKPRFSYYDNTNECIKYAKQYFQVGPGSQ